MSAIYGDWPPIGIFLYLAVMALLSTALLSAWVANSRAIRKQRKNASAPPSPWLHGFFPPPAC